jgi:hypothetical protein
VLKITVTSYRLVLIIVYYIDDDNNKSNNYNNKQIAVLCNTKYKAKYKPEQPFLSQ